MIFIETSVFTRHVQELLTDDGYAAIQSALAANPEVGDVIEGTGGLRKVRVAASGRGKRRGARVILLLRAWCRAHQDAADLRQGSQGRSISG